MWLVYFILGGVLRVWFGADDLPKILQNRGLQTVCMILTFMTIYVVDCNNWVNWVSALIVSCWLQFQFFSRSHGEIADCGRHTNITEEDIRRYNDRWYHIPCDYLFDKVLKKKKYGFLYDFFYLTMRYTCPMLPMMILDWRYILVGLSIAPIYAFGQTLEEREPWVFANKKWWWRRAWSFSEICAGAIVYSSCYLLRYGL